MFYSPSEARLIHAGASRRVFDKIEGIFDQWNARDGSGPPTFFEFPQQIWLPPKIGF
jgi:hypothetical protein